VLPGCWTSTLLVNFHQWISRNNAKASVSNSCSYCVCIGHPPASGGDRRSLYWSAVSVCVTRAVRPGNNNVNPKSFFLVSFQRRGSLCWIGIIIIVYCEILGSYSGVDEDSTLLGFGPILTRGCSYLLFNPALCPTRKHSITVFIFTHSHKGNSVTFTLFCDAALRHGVIVSKVSTAFVFEKSACPTQLHVGTPFMSSP